MYRKPTRTNRQSMFFTLEDQLTPRHPLYLSANRIDREVFEEQFKHRSTDRITAARACRSAQGDREKPCGTRAS